jgi:hypothetical protein
MHTLRFLFILLSLASVVFSRPLEITPVIQSEQPDAPDKRITSVPPRSIRNSTDSRVMKIIAAKYKANSMLDKMKHVIETPTLQQHREIIKASFGPPRNHDTNKIMETIEGMRNANIRTRVHPLLAWSSPEITIPADTSFIDPAEGVAGLPHGDAPTNREGQVADNIQFSQPFYDLNLNGTAGILIHEAAHYTAHASDFSVKHLFPPYRPRIYRTDTPFPSECTFRFPHAYREEDFNYPAKTPEASSSRNPHWHRLINEVSDMHECADAYRVFAHLCDNHLRTRDIYLSKRALLEGDKQAYCTILRRNAASCLPKRISKNTVSPLAKGH